ncbi:hypothetical protein BP00DRAFT_138307 [Aspergillus indologenus CBS 114.80]|uniref:Uncharacterized protein n=1 Tax=Aspergillus indologenus CBS 114.80 TaxID=1450541 RepID=A0A2V5I893_9EURO|nr:hypothetical protein BP00DRAFT_138307 [Aspergillus indologenus CBS 114.80]
MSACLGQRFRAWTRRGMEAVFSPAPLTYPGQLIGDFSCPLHEGRVAAADVGMGRTIQEQEVEVEVGVGVDGHLCVTRWGWWGLGLWAEDGGLHY